MAITQAMVAEEILSRQERAVIRGIYRAHSLAEALKALEGNEWLLSSTDPANAGISAALKDHYHNLKGYLANAIANALVNTKVPASATRGNETSHPAKA